jgi:hypothetical protein
MKLRLISFGICIPNGTTTALLLSPALFHSIFSLYLGCISVLFFLP